MNHLPPISEAGWLQDAGLPVGTKCTMKLVFFRDICLVMLKQEFKLFLVFLIQQRSEFL